MAKTYDFTKEDIERERDEHGLSWRQVATNLGLKSPSAARTAYTTLTGRHHSEANPVTQRRSASAFGSARMSDTKTFHPQWHNDLTEEEQMEVIEKCSNSTLLVSRSIRGMDIEESVQVGDVTHLTYEGPEGEEQLVLHTYEVQYFKGDSGKREKWSGNARSFRVTEVKAVM